MSTCRAFLGEFNDDGLAFCVVYQWQEGLEEGPRRRGRQRKYLTQRAFRGMLTFFLTLLKGLE